MAALGLTALFVLGLCVGSFGNVLIWRVPRRERDASPALDTERDAVITPERVGAETAATTDDLEPELDEDGLPPIRGTSQSIVQPGSYCPQCRTALLWYDNVPLVSWLALRGRCRHCDARIPVRYPIVEALTALLWVAMGLRFGLTWELPPYLVLAAGLVVLAAIDLELFLLPLRIVYPLGFMLVGLFAVAGFVIPDRNALVRSALACLVCGGLFLLLNFIYPRGMAFGDVRLSFVLGLALGWLGWEVTYLGFTLMFMVGAVLGIVLWAFDRSGSRTFRKRKIPFGVPMAVGAIATVLASEWIISAWQSYTQLRV